jgi:hypothetical protein
LSNLWLTTANTRSKRFFSRELGGVSALTQYKKAAIRRR